MNHITLLDFFPVYLLFVSFFTDIFFKDEKCYVIYHYFKEKI